MRWAFMLLVVLNLFYYAWHLQEMHAIPKDMQFPALTRSVQESIKLLSERSEPLSYTSPSVDQSSREKCLFIGGWGRRPPSEQLRQRVLSLGASGDITEESVSSDTDYWLYLAPLASREASLRQLRELQARQIESYLIAQGDLANGISLGMFARYEAAMSAAQRIRIAGYEPELRELPRSRNSYWVRIKPEERRLIGALVLQQLSVDFQNLQHRVESCEALAPL
jgi:hypothetical protein